MCILAGLLVWTSLPPLSWWWAVVPGLAAFFLAVREQRAAPAALSGYLFGLGFLVPTMSFLRGLGIDAWLVVAVLESVWFALTGLAVSAVSRRRWWPIAVPAVWIAVEWLRDRWPFGGFPWARIGFGQAAGPLLPLAAVGGVPLLTLAVVLLGATLAWAAHRRQRPALAVGGLAGVVAVIAVAAAVVTVPTGGSGRAGRPDHVVVAAVQGDVPRLGLDAFAQKRAVTQNHLAATLRLADDITAGRVARPAFVVWPENASDQDPFNDPLARAMIEQAVAAVDVPIVVGAVLDGPDARHVQNAAVVWSPHDGPGESYVKRHLVPFGEYLPLRGLLTRVVSRFSLIAKDFAPGHRPGVLDVAGVRLGDVICFEVADDGVVRQAVDGGGRLLVVQTNNATYERKGDDGRGGETAQQLQMSRVRAVEHGRAVIVVATSGVSAVIGPDGGVRQRTGVFTAATLVGEVPLRDARTLADRLGPWPERVIAILGALSLLGALPRRRRPRHAEVAAGAQPQPALATRP